jgi:hypothetical protein
VLLSADGVPKGGLVLVLGAGVQEHHQPEYVSIGKVGVTRFQWGPQVCNPCGDENKKLEKGYRRKVERE